MKEYLSSIDYGKEESITGTLTAYIIEAVSKEMEQIDTWIILELLKLGLKDFRSKRRIDKFLKKNKIEVKYDTVLSTIYILKDDKIEARYKTNF